MNIKDDQAPAKRQKVLKIRELSQEDCRQTTQELTDTFEISFGVCQEILPENLNMCHIAAKLFPNS
jgi:hypothetical protein